jgi:adenosine deaminase
MSVADFVRAMPKVELGVRLEGVFRKETLLLIAEQNEIAVSTKNFDAIVEQLDNPEFSQLDDLAQSLAGWMQHADDLTRIVYDMGVELERQNVRYAEVSVTPSLHMLPGMAIEEFLEAINDGRSRVERGWGVKIAWILTIPREEPRRADEVVRWASSAAGKKAGIVGIGLAGKEGAQPIGQFERAFNTAIKKDLPVIAWAGDTLGAEGIMQLFEHHYPARLLDGWGAADAPDVLKVLDDNQIPLGISMARALCFGKVDTYAAYPVRHLYDENVRLVITSDMPSFYNSTLSDEYLALVEHNGFDLDELQQIALNAVQVSLLPDDDKVAMIDAFTSDYAQLRDEHIESETAP